MDFISLLFEECGFYTEDMINDSELKIPLFNYFSKKTIEFINNNISTINDLLDINLSNYNETRGSYYPRPSIVYELKWQNIIDDNLYNILDEFDNDYFTLLNAQLPDPEHGINFELTEFILTHMEQFKNLFN